MAVHVDAPSSLNNTTEQPQEGVAQKRQPSVSSNPSVGSSWKGMSMSWWGVRLATGGQWAQLTVCFAKLGHLLPSSVRCLRCESTAPSTLHLVIQFQFQFQFRTSTSSRLRVPWLPSCCLTMAHKHFIELLSSAAAAASAASANKGRGDWGEWLFSRGLHFARAIFTFRFTTASIGMRNAGERVAERRRRKQASTAVLAVSVSLPPIALIVLCSHCLFPHPRADHDPRPQACTRFSVLGGLNGDFRARQVPFKYASLPFFNVNKFYTFLRV